MREGQSSQEMCSTALQWQEIEVGYGIMAVIETELDYIATSTRETKLDCVNESKD